MKIMKKYFTLILIIVTVIFNYGCSNSTNNISFELSDYSDEELMAIREQIDEHLSKDDNDDITITNSNKTSTVAPASDFLYASNGSEIQINSYTGMGGDVIIPDTIDDLPVTRIAAEAFYNCGDTITSLILPKNIEYIGSGAFRYLKNLSGILILPESLKTIDAHSFYCTSITGIVIKSSCDIKLNSFANIDSLEFIYVVDGANPTIAESTVAYSSELKFAIFPASMTNIGDNNFVGCNSMKIITPTGSYAEEYATRNFIACETDSYNEYVSEYSALYDN